MVYAANAVLIVASMVPRQTTETARASCVVRGSIARARMSRLMRVSMVSRKVLSFMGLDGLSFACVLQAWCKVGASGEGWQVRNAQKVRTEWKGNLESDSL